MTQYIEPLGIAGFTSLGILAQIVAPIPDDLKSWPITAILGLLLISCLGIIAWQTHSASKASIAASTAAVESAKAIQVITDKHEANTTAIKELTIELRDNTRQSAALVTTMSVRPCVAGR